MYGGFPVAGSLVGMRFTAEGDMLLLRTRGVVRGDHDVAFLVDRRDAGELARVAVPASSDEAYAWDPQQVVLARGADDVRPAWQVEVTDPTRVAGGWKVTVDGRTGEVLEVTDRVLHSIDGKVEGRGIGAKSQTTGGPPTVLPMAHLNVAASDLAALISQITFNTCTDADPVISGDGSTIAFSVDCAGSKELWKIDADGTGASLLVSNGADNTSPAISDDGSTIWFVSDVDGDPEIYTIQSDGSGLTQLTSNSAIDRAPSLADDGSFGTYESNVDGDFEIYRIANDGSGSAQLTSNTVLDVEAALSGDGSKIVWVSASDGDTEIFSMDADGSTPTQLTFNTLPDRRPSISDDGMQIAFDSRVTSTTSTMGGMSVGSGLGGTGVVANTLRDVRRFFRVWEIRADGTGLRQLTFGFGEQRDSQISGNGDCVAYATRATPFTDWEVELLDRGTGLALPLSNNTTDDRNPSVSDDCDRGVYESDDGDLELTAWDTTVPGAVGTAKTIVSGGYSMPFPDGHTASLFSALSGDFANVENLRGADLKAFASVSTPTFAGDLMFNPMGADERRTAQVTAYYHTTFIHDYLSLILTAPPLSLGLPLPIDGPLAVRVNNPLPIANAFYNPQSVHTEYFMAGPTWENTAIDTVIYHEYGHFTDDHFGGLTSGSPFEDPLAASEGHRRLHRHDRHGPGHHRRGLLRRGHLDPELRRVDDGADARLLRPAVRLPRVPAQRLRPAGGALPR